MNLYLLRTEHFDDFDDSDDSALTKDILLPLEGPASKLGFGFKIE